jgi:hypothetical protein
MRTQKTKSNQYFMARFGSLIEEFQSEAGHFSKIMANGAGLRTLGMIDTIRKLEHLYLQIACHLDAARDMEGGEKITLEDGLDALDAIRKTEQNSHRVEN